MFKTNVVTEKRPPNPVADLFLEPLTFSTDLDIFESLSHSAVFSVEKTGPTPGQ